MSAADTYEVFAIRYATRQGQRRDHFLGGDPHNAVMQMDYFVWLIRNAQRTVVVDTGFNAAMAAKRQRELLRSPSEGLALMGVDSRTVQDVVITHMHYDHVGTFDEFPQARFHLQDAEMQYATGRHMCNGFMNHAYEVEEVIGMVRLVYKDRVTFHRGEETLAPGISLHHIGGHTDGLQAVRVKTARGWVVLASDASHYYEHMGNKRFFSIAFNVGDMLDGYRTLERLADSPDHIIPGHDPLVMQYYPAASPELEGIAVRLDVSPRR
ncbi:MAG: N-acyl homoserine lactonase family protein [Limnohabitans sp.]|nr:N-acyl homoserine lactonase family protein [Limnohabitans sp.]